MQNIGLRPLPTRGSKVHVRQSGARQEIRGIRRHSPDERAQQSVVELAIGKQWPGVRINDSQGSASRGHATIQIEGQGQAAKDLVVGKVLKSTPADQEVEVHQFKGVWRRLRVCHLPMYIGADGAVTTQATATILRVTVRHPALVLKDELLSGGEGWRTC